MMGRHFFLSYPRSIEMRFESAWQKLYSITAEAVACWLESYFMNSRLNFTGDLIKFINYFMKYIMVG